MDIMVVNRMTTATTTAIKNQKHTPPGARQSASSLAKTLAPFSFQNLCAFATLRLCVENGKRFCSISLGHPPENRRE
jgi:hypothetical protein